MKYTFENFMSLFKDSKEKIVRKNIKKINKIILKTMKHGGGYAWIDIYEDLYNFYPTLNHEVVSEVVTYFQSMGFPVSLCCSSGQKANTSNISEMISVLYDRLLIEW